VPKNEDEPPMPPMVIALTKATAAVAGEAEARPELMSRTQFHAAVRPLMPRLYRLCLVLSRSETEAEDLLQNSLVKAYVHRADFARRGSFVGWLAGIVRHESDELARTAARRRSLFEAAKSRVGTVFEEWRDTDTLDPETWVASGESAETLLEALRLVPEPYRTVVFLCDIEEQSYQEAAELLEVPVGTVKSRHGRGRQKLRRALESRGGGR
jgi:RNA polymerase sigma-70 factor (ECF subfamily)